MVAAGCLSADNQRSIPSRHVWTGDDPDFLTGDISPDGRYFSDIDWDTGDLQIIDLTSGEARGLTGRGYSAGRMAWTSAFSNDSRRIATTWHRYDANAPELSVVDVDGSNMRLLVPANGSYEAIDPVDWSPSDELLLVALKRVDQVWQLGLVSVDDGTLVITKTLRSLAPGGAQSYPNAYFSPDGRYVAYDYPARAAARDRDIYTFSVEGGADWVKDGPREIAEEAEHVLVSGPGTDRLLGWLPDGKGILFYSDRSGTPDIWQQLVHQGRATGKPEVLQADIPGLVALGFTRDGYAYGVDVEAVQVHIGIVDFETGRVLMRPQPVDAEPWEQSYAGDWSPAGDRLAYVIHEPPPTSIEKLVVRATDGTKLDETALDPGFHTSSGTMRWIQDELMVLFGVMEGQEGIFRMKLSDGSANRIYPPDGNSPRGNVKWFEVGPNGQTLYMVAAAGAGLNDLIAIDVATGEERTIGHGRIDARTVAVSPDGDAVAFIERLDDTSELRVLPTAGSHSVQTLLRSPSDVSLSWPVSWTPDGTHLVYRSVSDPSGAALWSLGASGGGEPVQLGNADWNCLGRDLRIHPDGERFALTCGRSRGEIRILSGF